jgi:hypothetical protein
MDEQDVANICTDNCTETEIEETLEEKRRRLGRERTRRHRDKNRVEELPESFAGISALWQKNEEKLLKENPLLRLQIAARHKEVEELESEIEEIAEGVKNGLRAETRTAVTADSKEIFAMPDVSYAEIKADAAKNGVGNYRGIEAASIKGEPLDAVSRYYEKYGFRLRIQSGVLQQARESLVLYALRNRDASLDWNVVEEAINDCTAYRGFSSHADELRELIQEHRSPKAPVAEAPMPIS